MTGKYIVVANWKMNPASWRDAKKLFEATKKVADATPRISIIIAPPSMYLLPLSQLYKGKRLQFAAQHAHALEKGAFTGEVSIAEVEDAKARFCIIGHSERRAMGETNEDTAQKVAATLSRGLTPILCVGERQRNQSGEHFTFVKEQLKVGLSKIEENKVSKVLIAYEPVWAIGGEETMTPRDVHEMTIFIRKSIVESKGVGGMQTKMLYGGAVNDENAAEMLKGSDVAGLLVGHVSVDAARFASLINSIK